VKGGVLLKLTLSTPSFLKKERSYWKGMVFKGEWVIFFTILILFPSNLAKHLVLPSSYIQGILADYLLPKFYLTELLVFLLITLFSCRLWLTRSFGKRHLFLPFLLFLALFPSLGASGSISISALRLVELMLWLAFGVWVRENVDLKKDFLRIAKFLSFGVGWVSLLALVQFLLQRNVFPYYFLGEPVLYPSLPGVAKTSFFGQEVLRAYGTFPHPNVLGGVAAITVPWFLAEGYLLAAGIALLGLFVSFSRLAWVSLLLGLFLLGLLRVKKRWRAYFVAASLLAFFTLLFFLFPPSSDLTFSRRVELLQSAWAMFHSSFLSGIGLGLFTASLPHFGIPSGPTLFIQPVHNIFALVAAESGLLALVVFLALFLAAYIFGWKKQRYLMFFSLAQLTLLGLFDHYLYTLPQGLFLLSLTLGFIFSSSDEKKAN